MADMVSCDRCGHGNPLGANFCSSCGASLAATRPDSTETISYVPDATSDLAPDFGADQQSIPAGMGALVVTRGPNAGSRFVLYNDLTRAGRHPDSEIFLDDVTVSRRHAEFVRTADGGYVVRDAGSLNGTYLNMERVDDAPLSDGDEVQVGSFKLVFIRGGA